MPDQPLTGKALEQALRSGDLDSPALEVVGMVKAAEERGKVSFSRNGCESWVDVPTSLIKSAVQVGHSRCRDHTHPVFRLSFKESDDPAAQVLTALLASSAPSPMQASPGQIPFPPPLPGPSALEAQVGQQGGGLGWGYDSRCVRSCQWDCAVAGFPPWACWYVCAWLCSGWPRDVRM
jgi:hypothetical protein